MPTYHSSRSHPNKKPAFELTPFHWLVVAGVLLLLGLVALAIWWLPTQLQSAATNTPTATFVPETATPEASSVETSTTATPDTASTVAPTATAAATATVQAAPALTAVTAQRCTTKQETWIYSEAAVDSVRQQVPQGQELMLVGTLYDRQGKLWQKVTLAETARYLPQDLNLLQCP